jgi:hypothetical protein
LSDRRRCPSCAGGRGGLAQRLADGRPDSLFVAWARARADGRRPPRG